jgi:hypothetical protein
VTKSLCCFPGGANLRFSTQFAIGLKVCELKELVQKRECGKPSRLSTGSCVFKAGVRISH